MEFWDVLDRYGNKTGKKIKRGTPLKSGEYHLVVHIWITDDKGRLLIQKRREDLELMPGEWAATGGSAVSGETGEQAAIRELFEELGVVVGKGEMNRVSNMKRAHSMIDIWILRRNVNIDFVDVQKEEVEKVKWVAKQEFVEMVRLKSFHDYGKRYFDIVFEHIYGSY